MKKREKRQFKIGDPNPRHPDQKLLTRRDFLSSGLISFGGAVMMPSILDLVLQERSARAGEIDCSPSPMGAGMMPFLIFDCAGGASLSGNWLPGDHPGRFGTNYQLLNSYSNLGLGNANRFVTNNDFGAPMAAPPSDPLITPDLFSPIYSTLTMITAVPTAAQVLANPVTAAAQQAQHDADVIFVNKLKAGLRMGVFCHNSLSDSSDNMLSAITLVSSAGLQGSRVKSGLGTRFSDSAGNSQAASFNPAYRPMGISSVDSLTTALSYGPAFKFMPGSMVGSLANALLGLSAAQGRSLASMRLGDQFSALAQNGFLKNTCYTSPGTSVDARDDADLQAIYNLTNAGAGARDTIIGTLVKNAIDGASGPAVITIGGCDYHTGNRTDGDNKDAEIGLEIKRAIQVAIKKGKRIAFQIFTDGGIYSDAETRVWRGDANDKSMTVFGVFDPSGTPPSMINTQIGSYTQGQSADRTSFIGTDPQRVAHAVFLNYLAVCGKFDSYDKIIQGSTAVPARDRDALLLFGKSTA